MLGSATVAALIAGSVSVIVSMIGFLVAKHKLRHEISLFTRQADVDLIKKLYELRLDLYGKAFDITDRIYRRSESDWFQETDVRDWLNDLRDWKSGSVNLVISYGALNAFRELEQALATNPGHQSTYTTNQIKKVYSLRDTFRSSLRKDVRLLHQGDHAERNVRGARDG